MTIVTHEAGAPSGAAPSSGRPAAEPAIVTRGLTKRFRGGQVAVDALDLSVPRGSVFGFLGPNGSGKTTTIRMLLGLVAPTSGEHALLGLPLAEALPRVGALVEGPAFYPYLSGEANLRRFDAADPTAPAATVRRRVGEALDRVGLTAAAGKRYRNYSLGMRQRLAIAAALLGPRELLILDEPTNGLDPQGTREVRTLVKEIAAEGTTVFVSSHLLAEVEQMCTHAAIMRAGRLVTQGTIASLSGGQAVRVRIETPDAAAAVAVLTALGLPDVRTVGPAGPAGPVAPDVRTAGPAEETGTEVTRPGGRGTEVTAELGGHAPERINAALVGEGVPVRGFTVVRPSLEDVFVGLTGEGFDVDG
ncbi:ABC-2 type transport system ATP-binding protein [Nonomuraea muscovyensis]|uniref:ABC-2 type transport system ATP-binding protein n=1 Tax=Nonomuraea muscovyensis TaxID=1124761 RepID=A0A7X0F3E2_9ACTN|nr:ABC transporter ATP-binding protein [Nonomuraea muscovyensis]MBB6352056.1 ABC-2 type transport system ATP-binding protein [Nonomuraea muscovyensis]